MQHYDKVDLSPESDWRVRGSIQIMLLQYLAGEHIYTLQLGLDHFILPIILRFSCSMTAMHTYWHFMTADFSRPSGVGEPQAIASKTDHDII